MSIEITGVITAVKAIKDFASVAFNAKVDAEVQAARIAVMEQLGKAQESLYELRDELFKIQNENEQLRRAADNAAKWDETASHYTFGKSPGGAYVFMSLTDTNLFACPTCMHEKRLSPLQPQGIMPSIRHCPVCKQGFTVTTEQLI